MDNVAIDERLQTLDDLEDDAPGFEVLRRAPAPCRPDMPLVVFVHPGDALCAPHCWVDTQAYRRARNRSIGKQVHMAIEVFSWLQNGADAVVLHRGSCSQLAVGPNDWIDGYYIQAIDKARDRGTVLFGDDLDAAGAWVLQELHIESRPAILVTGAFATPKDGCVTEIARQLRRRNKNAAISKFAPKYD